MRTRTTTAICMLALAAAAARADDPAPSVEGVIETHTYDVSDLIHAALRAAPPAPAADNAQGGGGALFVGNRAAETHGDTDDAGRTAQLLALIQQSIDPNSWRTNGGKFGTIATMDDALVITQTPANQRGVAQLLADLHKTNNRDTMVRVDAAWLLLTPTEMAGGPDRKPPAITAENVYCQARTVGFSGQAQTVNVDRTASIITGLTPVVAPGVAVFDPTMGTAQSGVTLSVTPRLSPNHDSLLVDVESAVTTTVPRADPPLATTRPAGVDEASAASLRAFANRPDLAQQRFSTTVRLRPGVPLIVGGMSDQPGTTGDHRSLCLVLTAYVDDKAAAR